MTSPPPSRRLPVVLSLGAAQTLAWASSYYLPAMLAVPMARDLGIGVPTVFAAFSFALVVTALLGPFAGRAIDRRGGRTVLAATSLVFALGLFALAQVSSVAGLFAAWVVIGIGMGCGLYEAAFATLVRLYGPGSRSAITGITLLAGFASTIGWPLSTLLEHQLGWRGACLVWAALHLLVGLPLNLLVPRAAAKESAEPSRAPVDAGPSATLPPDQSRRAGVLLAVVFAVTLFISTAMAAHLPRLLQLNGVALAAAVGVGALVGPAQVAGRLLEFGALRRLHPLLSARLAALMHPLGAAWLAFAGGVGAAPFALMHGAGNGILTITKGTLPLALFGAVGYGARQGILVAPARIAQAAAPWLFGLCLDRWGAGAIWLSAALGLLSGAALFAMPKAPR